MKRQREPFKIVTLGEVATIERRGINPAELRTGDLFVGLENLSSDGNFLGVTSPQAGEIKSTKFAFDSRHVLYGKLRPYLCKIARPDFEGVCSTDILPILPGPSLDRNFLFHFLRQPKMVELATARCSGANLPRLSPKTLAEFEIPLPPLSEQKRIAGILDQADALRRKRRQALELTEQFLRATFLDMFGDPVSNPKGWPIKTIGDIAEVKTGATPSRSISGNFGGDIPWVKTTEVNRNVITKTEESLTTQGMKNSRCVLHPINSIVIALYGQGATRGRSAILGIDATTNQACAVVAPSSQYDTYFLWTYLQISYHRLREQGRGGNQPNLNLDIIRKFSLPYPPITLQKEFSRIRQQMDSLQTRVDEHHRTADALFHSLTQRAFGGGL